MTGQAKMTLGDLLAGHEKYEAVRELSSGSFGRVILARDRSNGKAVAIKFMQRVIAAADVEKCKKYWQQEVFAHSQLHHPHVVQFKEVFLTPHHLAIAMEYIDGCTLLESMNNIKAFPEPFARRIFQQLIVAIEYCHLMGISNRDIKLENTMLRKDAPAHVFLIDFGYAKTDYHSLPKSLVGTRGYTAPEIVCGTNASYDAKVADIWSCGVILYIMLIYGYPFERRDDPPGATGLAMVIQRILNVEYVFPARPRLSDGAKDLIRRILIPEPQERLTIKGIMAHPWFVQDFPEELVGLNERMVAEGAVNMQQSPQEILSILQAAPICTPGDLVPDYADTDDKGSGMYQSGLTDIISEEFKRAYNEPV